MVLQQLLGSPTLNGANSFTLLQFAFICTILASIIAWVSPAFQPQPRDVNGR
jgi:hypothetical protein